MTVLNILNINTVNFNIFKTTVEELVAKALDEAGLIKDSTVINNILCIELCKSFDQKKLNFLESTKLGNLLVKNNIVTKPQLEEALAYQKQNPEYKLGTILIKFNFCSIDDIEKFLLTQIEVREDIKELDEFMLKIARIKEKIKNYNLTK